MAKYDVRISGEFESDNPEAAIDTLISMATRLRNGEDVRDNLKTGECIDFSVNFTYYKEEE